jgi:2-polyprenyl-3-methyl-5-hydroxy-6-metoxy-1,4-benzoquinol methylase
MSDQGVKTTREHWDRAHATAPRMRLPSRWVVTTRDIQGLLRRQISPGMQVMEIGCAPGKQLAYVAKMLGAKVSGIDYSAVGVRYSEALFKALGIDGDVRCEDMFSSSFSKGAFDVVYSIGVVEHFDDPTEVIELHAQFLRAGGTALIAIPNYGGIYGRLQAQFDPENLAIHNLDMMHKSQFLALAPSTEIAHSEVFHYGRFNPWLVSWQRKLPAALSKSICILGNALGLVQPVTIDSLSAMLVLKMTRSQTLR